MLLFKPQIVWFLPWFSRSFFLFFSATKITALFIVTRENC